MTKSATVRKPAATKSAKRIDVTLRLDAGSIPAASTKPNLVERQVSRVSSG